jgi:hypothetical protein
MFATAPISDRLRGSLEIKYRIAHGRFPGSVCGRKHARRFETLQRRANIAPVTLARLI